MAGVSGRMLGGLELSLDAGLHAILGAPSDGTEELIEMAVGLVRPRRGRVRVAGRDPHASPDVRRRIASLLPRERLIPAGTVGASVARALALAGQEAASADTVLAAYGLDRWAERRPDSLDAAKQRSVALALALARDKPVLVALHEPLSGVPGVARRTVLDALSRLANAGACVVCSTASVRDASDIAPSVLLLDRGRLVRRTPEPLPVELAPGTAFDFMVHSDEPRRLASVLAGVEAVSGVDWDEQRSPAIRVRGTDPGQLGLAIARALVESSIQVRAISPILPGLNVIRGANDGLERAAYEQASLHAQAEARAALRVAPRTDAPATPLYGPRVLQDGAGPPTAATSQPLGEPPEGDSSPQEGEPPEGGEA